MEKIGEFRHHIIKRTCSKHYQNYSSYKKYLKKDFQNKCAYCNVSDEQITTYFEVDHFIPSKICKEYNRHDLITDYNNLIYSCKKCNLAKSDLYDGGEIPEELSNDRFYNPVEIDYNKIFYRNIIGGIDSKDIKGRNMIVDLKLYRIFHNYAWISEELFRILSVIDSKIEGISVNDPKRKIFLELHRNISSEAIKYQKLFFKVYNI
ncbi:TPA: HNH endonuclease [Streptococcus suis]